MSLGIISGYSISPEYLTVFPRSLTTEGKKPLASCMKSASRLKVYVKKLSTFDALEILVEQINEDRRLRHLKIQWLQHSRPLQYARSQDSTWHFHYLDRDHGLERNAERGGC